MLDLSDAAIGALVGWNALARGAEYVRQGRVSEVAWVRGESVLHGVVEGNHPTPYRTNVLFNGEEASRPTVGVCSCPVHLNCKHVAATLLAAGSEAGDSIARQSWERVLDPLVRPAESTGTEMALQLDFRPTAAEPLRARPLMRGRRGGWIRGHVGWQLFTYAASAQDWDSGQHHVLAEIRALGRDRWSHHQDWKRLDNVAAAPLWALLLESRQVDITLLGDDLGNPAVLEEDRPVVHLDACRVDEELVLRPVISLGGEPVAAAAEPAVVGDPHQLLLRRDEDGVLRLALLERPVAPVLARMINAGERVSVPVADEERFLADYFPLLRTRVEVRSGDGSFAPPQPRRPVLALELKPLSGHRLELRWDWWYRNGDTDPGERYALVVGPGARRRDLHAEQQILNRLDLKRFDVLLDRTVSRSLQARTVLETEDMITFLTTVLPHLEDDPGLVIIQDGRLPEYAEATRPPLVTVRTEHIRGERDWLELSVTVEVDGEKVPFASLFTALAKGETRMVLPSGTWFRLDSDEFRQLADLINEARAIGEPQADGVKISRYQVDWWQEIERLGIDVQQASGWRELINGLSGDGPQRIEQPAGFTATLRDYQRAGLDWLAFLHDHGLGGVLADDMGLGKTLQTLALICHARERGTGGDAPYLVVAPTSVVGNWAAEATRFSPHLKVVAITETERRAGTPLAERIAGADLVLTSYTLLRIDDDSYLQQTWAGLILDEAQFVKNHQSRAYQCVRRLPAPFKLAITGTPMENNLTELWSMFSITAPGLFAGPIQFRDDYARPIEREHDQARLDRLRRRVRPFMLRRTKDQVAAELPPRQEQVIALDLLPKHRKIYQTHLHRERQKILGLLDDLDSNRFEVFRSLTLLRQLSLDASLHDDQYADVPSTKLEALDDLVTEILAEDHRVLIFSQFTGFLTKVAEQLDRGGIPYAYLDGRTKNRTQVIDGFKQGAAPVFLISLKAGGFGLNLTEADYCILLDPWWNPASEQQAIDRIHRIGQTRAVMVYRLVAKDTIEEKVMALKADKAKLFASVMDGGAAGSGRLSAREIRELIA